VRIGEGLSYLIEEPKPVLAYGLLRLQLDRGVPGLCISRLHPNMVRQRFHILTARLVWLSEIPGENHHSAKALAGLAKKIEDFVASNADRGTILLDGLEHLVNNNDFESTLLFVEHVNEFIMTRRASFLLPVSPKALEGRQLAMLERDLEVPDVRAWLAELDRAEWSRRLDRAT
jgi:hypothetical protein